MGNPEIFVAGNLGYRKREVNVNELVLSERTMEFFFSTGLIDPNEVTRCTASIFRRA